MARPFVDLADFRPFARAAADTLAQAVTAAITAATNGAKTEIRAAIGAAGLGRRLPNAVGSAVYPPRGQASIGAAGTIYARGPNADMILNAFNTGATIKPGDGRKYLMIPTKQARDSGLATKIGFERGADGATRIRRRRAFDLAQAGRLLGLGDRYVLTFIPPGRAHRENGYLVARGVVRRQGGRGYVAATKARLAAGRKRTDIILAILVPEVRLPKRFNTAAIMAQWAARLPALIDRAMPGER